MSERDVAIADGARAASRLRGVNHRVFNRESLALERRAHVGAPRTRPEVERVDDRRPGRRGRLGLGEASLLVREREASRRGVRQVERPGEPRDDVDVGAQAREIPPA